MHEHEARLERLQAEVKEAPKAARKLRLPGHGLVGGGPVRSGEIVIRGRGPRAVGVPAVTSSWRRRRSSRHGAGTGSGSWGRTGPGRRRSCGPSRATCRRSTGRSRSAMASQLGYLAQLRAAGIPGTTVLDALLETVPVTPGEARGVPRAIPVPWRRRVQGGAAPVRRRALAPGAGAARGHALERLSPRRTDEPPRRRRARGDRDVPPRDARDDAGRLARSAVPRDGLRAAVGRRRRRGRAVRWRLQGLARRGVRTAGRLPGRSSRTRRRRLQPGARTRRAGRAPAMAPAGSRSGRGASLVVARGAAGSAAPPRRPGGCRAGSPARSSAVIDRARSARGPKLSKDAYRRQREQVDGELTRLDLRKNHLELELSRPAVQSNFIELRRVTSELADVERRARRRPRMRGLRSRSARRDRESRRHGPANSHRAHRSHRLRQVDGGGLARRARCRRDRRGPGCPRRHAARAAPRWRRSSNSSGPTSCGQTARSIAPRSAGSCSLTRPRWQARIDHPPRRAAADSRAASPTRTARPCVVSWHPRSHRGDQARRGRTCAALRRGVAGHVRPSGAARATCRARSRPPRFGSANRRSGRPRRPPDSRRHPHPRHVRPPRRISLPRPRRLEGRPRGRIYLDQDGRRPDDAGASPDACAG